MIHLPANKSEQDQTVDNAGFAGSCIDFLGLGCGTQAVSK